MVCSYAVYSYNEKHNHSPKEAPGERTISLLNEGKRAHGLCHAPRGAVDEEEVLSRKGELTGSA